MKAYIGTTGVIFFLVTCAHVARMVSESHRLATEPWYLLITALSLGLCLWAVSLLRREPGKPTSR